MKKSAYKWVLLGTLAFAGIAWLVFPRAYDGVNADIDDGPEIEVSRSGDMTRFTDNVLGLRFAYPSAWGTIEIEEGYAQIPDDVSDPSDGYVLYHTPMQRRLVLTKDNESMVIAVGHDTRELDRMTVRQLNFEQIFEFVCHESFDCSVRDEVNENDIAYRKGSTDLDQFPSAVTEPRYYQFLRNGHRFGSVIFMDFYAIRERRDDVLMGFERYFIDGLAYAR